VSVLVDFRRSEFAELDASYEIFDLRTRWFRMVRGRARGVVTDWGLLNRAVPFVHRFEGRTTMTIVLSGSGRFDEANEHAFLRPGDIALGDMNSFGTEAWVGDTLVLEWDPRMLGTGHRGRFAVERLSNVDIERLRQLAARLPGPAPLEVMVEVFDLLRANGLPIARMPSNDIARMHTPDPLQPLQNVMSKRLAALQEFPTIEEISAALDWDQRQVHRKMAQLRDNYRVVWSHWRELVHQARLMRAMQLLANPKATTELVARLSGFRAPTALCHAFAKAGLPSPGRLAALARSDTLGAWSELVA
jgi:AraC-like DNA-binding protein